MEILIVGLGFEMGICVILIYIVSVLVILITDHIHEPGLLLHIYF